MKSLHLINSFLNSWFDQFETDNQIDTNHLTWTPNWNKWYFHQANCLEACAWYLEDESSFRRVASMTYWLFSLRLLRSAHLVNILPWTQLLWQKSSAWTSQQLFDEVRGRGMPGDYRLRRGKFVQGAVQTGDPLVLGSAFCRLESRLIRIQDWK